MFTRTTLATAMVASVAVAQQQGTFEVYVQELGKEEDFNASLTIQSAECTGTFNGDATQTFFFGVSHVEGEIYDKLVGWGRNLCANSADGVNFDTDYTIQVTVDGATFDTGQRLVCDEALTTRMQKNFKHQVDDNSILRALVGYEADIDSGALTILDSNLSKQSGARTKALEVVGEFTADQESWLATTEFYVLARLNEFYQDVAYTQEATYDAEITADLAAMEESIQTFADSTLNADALATWNSEGQIIMDQLTTLIDTEYQNVQDNIYTYIQTEINKGETEAAAAATATDAIITAQDTELTTAVNAQSTFDADKIDKTLTKPIGNAAKATDKSAKDMEKAATSAAKSADKEGTKGQKSDNKAANKTISNTIKTDSRDIKSFLKADDKKGSRKMSAEFKKLIKDVKTMSGKLQDVISTAANTQRDAVEKETGNDFERRKKGRDDELTTYANEFSTVLTEDTWYPEINIGDFDLDYYLNSGFSVQVQITRTKDNVTGTCDVTSLPIPAEHCHHTTFDDLYFDYLCNMVEAPVYKGTAMTCATTERPSSAYCALLNPADEEICSTQIKLLEDALADTMGVAGDYVADEWNTYYDLIAQMDETGLSYFTQTFLDWAYYHDSENPWCSFDTDQTWDPATQTTKEADGSTVLTADVCYTGQDTSLNYSQNARTARLMTTDYSTSTTTTTTTSAHRVRAPHPIVGDTSATECVWDNSINDYDCPDDCWYDTATLSTQCMWDTAAIPESTDPLYDLAYNIEYAIFPEGGITTSHDTIYRDIIVTTMQQMAWLDNNGISVVDEANMQASSSEQIGYLIAGADPFSISGFSLDTVDMDTIYEIANCVAAAQATAPLDLMSRAASMDLATEITNLSYEISYDTGVYIEDVIPQLSALPLTTWAEQILDSLAWADYDYSIAAFADATFTAGVYEALAAQGIDASAVAGLSDDVIMQYGTRLVDIVLYRDCATAQNDDFYDDLAETFSLHPVSELLVELEWALFGAASPTDTSTLNAYEVIGTLVQGMLVSDAATVTSYVAYTDTTEISDAAYVAAERILGATPDASVYDDANVDKDTIFSMASCWYEAENRSFSDHQAIWEMMPLEYILSSLAVELYAIDWTTAEATISTFTAEISTWTSQAIDSLTWAGSVYTITGMGDVEAGIRSKMTEYNVDHSDVTAADIEIFITEIVDQVLFGACAHALSYDDDTCTAYDAAGVCTAWDDDTCTAWDAAGVCTSWDTSTDYNTVDDYCLTWDDTGVCTSWTFCYLDSDTNTDVCTSKYDSWCRTWDSSNSASCTELIVPPVDDFCVTYSSSDASTCEAWNFCQVDTAGVEQCYNDFDDWCVTWDDNYDNCLAVSEPVEDTCTTWDAAGVCTAWADDDDCTAWDAAGVCTAWYDDDCTAWDSDGVCTSWDTSGDLYDHDDYCTAWDPVTQLCSSYLFCYIDATTNADVCTDKYDSWCRTWDSSNSASCTELIVPPVDDFCTTWDSSDASLCVGWNFCTTDSAGVETCYNDFDDWCVTWDDNYDNCLAVAEPVSDDCVYNTGTASFDCPEFCWWDATTTTTMCYEDPNVYYTDCAVYSDDGTYCVTDWYEYYSHSRSCLPNEPLVQYAYLIETAFFENQTLAGTSIASSDYVDYATWDPKEILNALMNSVNFIDVDTGEVDATTGAAIYALLADRDASTSPVATIVESVGYKLLSDNDPVQLDWWSQDAVTIDTLYDIADAIKPVSSLTADELAWKATEVNVVDKLFEYASHMYGHDYSTIESVVDLYSLNADFKAMIDLAMGSLSWTSNLADVTIGEIDAIVALVHGLIADMGQTAEYFGLDDAIIMDYTYEVVNDILYGEGVCYLTGQTYDYEVCTSTQEWDYITSTCIDIPTCYPWEIEQADGTCLVDTTYTGEICTDTQWYDWITAACYEIGEDAYGCLPWEIELASGECIEDPNYAGTECTATQYYDLSTSACADIPACMPWETLESDGTCLVDGAYTGEVCTDTQYWDWTYAYCEDIYISPCEAWEYENDNGVCVEDPYYFGDVCEDYEELIDGVCTFVEPVFDYTYTHPASEILYFIQSAFLDGQSVYIDYVDVWALDPYPIIALLKANTQTITDSDNVTTVDLTASTQGLVAEVGYQINDSEWFDSTTGYDESLVNTDLLLELATCAWEAEWATADDLDARLATKDIFHITENYLYYEFGLDSTVATELGIDLALFPFSDWATLAVSSIGWASGVYTVGEMDAVHIAVYALLEDLRSQGLLDLSNEELGIDDTAIDSYVFEIVDQVLYGACVETQHGTIVIDEGCLAWDDAGVCIDYEDTAFWGCIERDATTDECLTYDYVDYEACIDWRDGVCYTYDYVDPWATEDDVVEYTDEYFILDPKMQITQFGAEYLMAPSGVNVYDGILIDWLSADDDAAVAALLDNVAVLDQWTWPYMDVANTDAATVIDAILTSLTGLDSTALNVDITLVDMNEIALIADRLFDVESYDADHHYETYRYTNIEALIIQYAGENYGLDADTLYSVVDFDLLDIDPAARLAIDSLTWSDHAYTISQQEAVRDLFTTALTEATGLDASFFNLSDDVIDEFTQVIIDQTLYGTIANEFWNLSLDTWEDVWTGTDEEWAAEQLTWTRDLDIVYQIADAFFWPSNLYASEFVDFSTIDSAYVIQTLLDNMTWVDENVTPRVVDEANTKEVDVITNVGAALLQDAAAITSIATFLPELVDKAHLYYLANDIEIVEHYDAEAITNILNGMNVYQFVLDHAEYLYGVTNDQLLAVIDLTTSTDLDTIATNAVTSVTWADDGSFTIAALDAVRAEVYTLLDTILVSGTATDAGVTDELIDDYVTSLVYEVLYGNIPDYEHTGFVNWLADIDIVSVAKDLVMERFAVDETVVDPIFEAVDVWELSYYTLNNLQYTYDTATLEDIYYIDDSTRQYLYTEVRSYIETTTVDLGGITVADITDASMDIIIDEMINILAFGDPSDFNDAQWLTYMTDMITDPNLTEEQVIDFLIYDQQGWTDWMFANPIDYENWLADYEDELAAWSLQYEYLLAEYVSDPEELEQWEAFDDPIDDWVDLSAEIFTGKEQKEFEALNAIEAAYDAEPRKAEWDALKDSLTEIYWTRVNQGLEVGSTSRLAQAEPALLQRCDKDRQDLGESLWTQNSELVFSKADLYYMGDFLDRVWEYIWEEWYVTETSDSGILA